MQSEDSWVSLQQKLHVHTLYMFTTGKWQPNFSPKQRSMHSRKHWSSQSAHKLGLALHSSIHPFINSLQWYLLSTYYVPDIVLSSGLCWKRYSPWVQPIIRKQVIGSENQAPYIYHGRGEPSGVTVMQNNNDGTYLRGNYYMWCPLHVLI